MLLGFLLLPLQVLILWGWGRVFRAGAAPDFSAEVFLGGAVISTLSVFVSFLVPLDLYYGFAVCLAGLAFGLYQMKKTGLCLKIWLPKPLYLPILLLLFASSLLPVIVDQMGYYLPTLEGLKTFGTLRGASNLELTQGQLSYWHYLEAALPIDPYLRLNWVFCLVLVLEAFRTKAWSLMLGLPVWVIFLSSASPDLPGLILGIWLVHRLRVRRYSPLLLTFLGVWLLGVKLIFFWPLGVVVGYLLLKREFSWNCGIVVLAGTGLLLFKTIYTFGYPIFPLAVFPLSEIRPDDRLMQLSSEMGLLKTFDMQYRLSQILEMSSGEKILTWLNIGGLKSVLHYGFVLCLGFHLFLWTKNKTLLFRLSSGFILLKVCLVLYLSAQYRFFLDFFLLTAYWGFGTWVPSMLKWRFSVYSGLIVAFCLAFPQVLERIFRPARFMKPFEMESLLRPAYFVRTPPIKARIGNLEFFTSPQFPFLLDTPAPAITPGALRDYDRLGIFPQWEGKALIQKPLSPEDKIRLKHLLRHLKY